MTYTREEYQELLEKQGKERLNGQKPGFEYLVQAQVKMENLTGDQYWDIYLSYLQDVVERISVQSDHARDRLCNTKMVDPNAIIEIKMEIAGLNSQIKLLEAIIGLPKAIMESADTAKERLKDLGG